MAWADQYYAGMAEDSGVADEGFLSKLAKTAWTPLEFLLQTLDKPGRAVRGLLAGRPEELANLIPFSDTAGLTDPNTAASGRDVLRNFGMISQDEDTWGNWAGGLATEIALDPLNFLTLGTKASLTAAGKAAKMAGTLENTAAGRIASGQAGLAGLRTPWYTDMLGITKPSSVALGTGATAERIAQGGADLLDWSTRKVPGVAKARSWFEYGAGNKSGIPETVLGFSGVAPQAEKDVLQAAYPHGMDLISSHKSIIDDLVGRGHSLAEAEDYAGKLVTGVRENANPTYAGLGPVHPDLLDKAQVAADSIGTAQDVLRDHLISLGYQVPENYSSWGHKYLHRQSIEGGVSRNAANKARSIPEALLPGGSLQHDANVANPELAGFANRPVPQGMTVQQWEKWKNAKIDANADEFKQIAKDARDAQFQGNHPASLADKEIEKQAKPYARYLSEINPETVDAGKGGYRNDPIGALQEYVSGAQANAAAAKGSLNTLASEAKSRDSIATDPGNWVSLNKAMNDLGLTAQEALPKMAGQGAVIDFGGKKSLIDMLVDKGKSTLPTGQPLPKKDIIKDLKDKFVPQHVVDALQKELEPAAQAATYGIGSQVEKWTSAARAAFTTPWPAFHARNVVDAGIQQGLAGGMSAKRIADTIAYRAGSITDPALAAEAAQVMNAGFNAGAFGRGQAFAQLGKSAVNLPSSTVNPLVTQGGTTTGQAAIDYLKQFLPSSVAARGESYLSKNPLRIFSAPEESAILQGGNRLHNDIDITNRMSHFWGLMDQGYAPHAAADVVTQAHLDYSKLTPAERMLRQAIPFYSFSKQNLGRFAEQLQNPGPITSLIRGVGSIRQDENIPNYVSQGSAIPIPGAEDGSQRYISGMSLPFDDEIMGAVISAASGRFGEAGRRALTAADPLTKLLTTIGTGRQIFSGRSLEDATPGPITSLGGLLPNYQANVLSEVLSASPLGRVMSTANSTVNGRDVNPLVRLLTGIKTTDVDKTQAKNLAARDAVESLLKSTGQVGVSENLYPKDQYRDVANQSPELQRLLSAMKMLQQQARDAKASRLNQLSTP